ncbi:MAG: hypothetical protein RIR70_1168 [Pseudomonadota bacterium]|jgi:hypothetical protein
MKILGVDFTSAPRRAKPIIAAWGQLEGECLRLESLQRLDDWPAFESLLGTPGPWVGAFDLPLGLPRELVEDLGWPTQWPALVRHCQALGKEGFRHAIDRYRNGRAPGNKFAHRATDRPAGSSSPMKLVNPPVALMFLAGAPRLLVAGLHIPLLNPCDDNRIALEGYPGHAARAITRASYKSDTVSQHTAERQAARGEIIEGVCQGHPTLGLRLIAPPDLRAQLASDGSGDKLDATLCALQAAYAARLRHAGFGLPADADPIEGWIASVRPSQPTQ